MVRICDSLFQDPALRVALVGSLLACSLLIASLFLPAFEYDIDIEETAYGWEAFALVPTWIGQVVASAIEHNLAVEDMIDPDWHRIYVYVFLCWLPNPLLLVSVFALTLRQWRLALVTGSFALLGSFAFWMFHCLLPLVFGDPGMPLFVGYYFWVASMVAAVTAAARGLSVERWYAD